MAAHCCAGRGNGATIPSQKSARSEPLAERFVFFLENLMPPLKGHLAKHAIRRLRSPRSGGPCPRCAWSMSALGHKQTSTLVQTMSALPPKADMVQQDRDVGFVPQADILCLDMGELVLAVVAQQKHAGCSSTDQGEGTRPGVKICGLLLFCGSTKNGPIVSERREVAHALRLRHLS